MTRFDATTEPTRIELVADAIAAHRERGSAATTLTVEPTDADREIGHGAPWIQYFEGTVALDCTDYELEQLKKLLDDFPSFSIDELVTPEEAEGTHARVTARTDDERIGQFVDRVFREVFDRSEGYRLWVAEI
ncbi:hypothetical protein [Haloarchaeobius amylolyticus]|uniref:hypothetical protein n=1 Tax=Haloarchaeobius amylolyticus TaxID=1198296 RepID=UPI00226FA5CD|nr:hypothetical protein [Haloarchaeobius amylolyticus]